MRQQRIHITGASGSGTTTLGQALAQQLGCPVFDADDYFWLPTTPPFQKKRDKAERLRLMEADCQSVPACIVSGWVHGWGETFEQSFDHIVFLTIPTELRLARLREREIRKFGKVDEEFIAWAARYDDGDESVRSRFLHEQWFAKQRCPILRLEGDLSVEERLSRTLQFLTPEKAPQPLE